MCIHSYHSSSRLRSCLSTEQAGQYPTVTPPGRFRYPGENKQNDRRSTYFSDRNPAHWSPTLISLPKTEFDARSGFTEMVWPLHLTARNHSSSTRLDISRAVAFSPCHDAIGPPGDFTILHHLPSSVPRHWVFISLITVEIVPGHHRHLTLPMET